MSSVSIDEEIISINSKIYIERRLKKTIEESLNDPNEIDKGRFICANSICESRIKLLEGKKSILEEKRKNGVLVVEHDEVYEPGVRPRMRDEF